MMDGNEKELGRLKKNKPKYPIHWVTPESFEYRGKLLKCLELRLLRWILYFIMRNSFKKRVCDSDHEGKPSSGLGFPSSEQIQKYVSSKSGGGGARLSSQHWGGRGKWISVSSRPAGLHREMLETNKIWCQLSLY